MPSYCPHCGSPSPDEARFCMKCGRERLPEAAAAPPPAPPALPPAPAYPAGPTQPSPVGQFFGRVLRGDWAQPAKAALFPAGLLLALGVVLAFPTYGQDDEVVVGWSERLRIALAMLLQGVGGGFGIKAVEEQGSPFGSDSGSDSGFGSSDAAMGSATLSLVPLTVTLLFIGALYLGARMLRTRGDGLEAAVRLSVVVTAVVLVIGLFAQPEIEGVEISSSPLLAALGTLAISLVVACGVLQRDHLAAWLSQRPGARSAVRALGTAVRALGAVVALCSLVGFVVFAAQDDVDGTALLGSLAFLPNIGFAVLGLSWGVPVEYDIQGEFSELGSGSENGEFGLSELGDVWGNGAVAGAVSLGVVCALVLGVRAARRSPDRREQLLSGGFLLGLILLFMGACGLAADVSGGVGGLGGSGRSEVAPSVPDTLLFGLLWLGAAVFLGPVLLKLVGAQPVAPPYPPGFAPGGASGAWAAPAASTGFPGVAPAPAGPEAPGAAPTAGAPGGGPVPDGAGTPDAGAPGAPAGAALPVGPPHPGVRGTPAAGPVPVYDAETYVPAGYDPHTVHLAAAAAVSDPGADANAAARKRRILVWTATLTAAFVIGGGATAGLLLMQKDDGTSDEAVQNKPPAASPSPSQEQEPTEDPATGPTAGPSTDPTANPTPSRPAGTLPAGFVLKNDPAGFTVAVMDGWQRRQEGSQIYYEAPTGGSYLQIGVIKSTPTSSYDNFVDLEKKRQALPDVRYQRLQLTRNTYQGRPGALWEFTNIPDPSKSTVLRHVIDQAFVAADGTEYAILAADRADLWDAENDVVFRTALDTFKIG